MLTANRTSNRLLARRSFIKCLAVASWLGVLTACASTPASTPLPSVSLDSMPAALGRGFPVGTLVGADNTATGIAPGKVAPNFRMQFSDDHGLYLADLVGRPILINFWATWCGPCRLEMPEIVHHAEQAQELLVLAINVQEEREPVAAFAQDFSMNMPVVLDENGEIRDLYEVRGMPTSVFIDRAGKIATYREGVMSPRLLEELLATIT